MHIMYISQTTKRISLILRLLVGSVVLLAQKPSQLQINSLIDQIPIPESSEESFSRCATTADANGFKTFKDTGPGFTTLEDVLTRIMKTDQDALVSGNSGQTPATTAGSSVKPVNPNLMKQIGQAQSTVMQINALITELGSKLGKLTRHPPTTAPFADCMKYSCACSKETLIKNETRFIEPSDNYLQLEVALIKEYVPKIKDQVAIIDKLESDTKYGEAVTDPNIIRILWSIQRQGMNGFSSVLGMCNGISEDAAKIYLNLVNAKNKKC
jgi:hypothetical protein